MFLLIFGAANPGDMFWTTLCSPTDCSVRPAPVINGAQSTCNYKTQTNYDTFVLPFRSGKSILHCFLKLLGLLGERREPSLVRLLGRDMVRLLSQYLFSHISPSQPLKSVLASNFLFYLRRCFHWLVSPLSRDQGLGQDWLGDWATCHPVLTCLWRTETDPVNVCLSVSRYLCHRLSSDKYFCPPPDISHITLLNTQYPVSLYPWFLTSETYKTVNTPLHSWQADWRCF